MVDGSASKPALRQDTYLAYFGLFLSLGPIFFTIIIWKRGPSGWSLCFFLWTNLVPPLPTKKKLLANLCGKMSFLKSVSIVEPEKKTINDSNKALLKNACHLCSLYLILGFCAFSVLTELETEMCLTATIWQNNEEEEMYKMN